MNSNENEIKTENFNPNQEINKNNVNDNATKIGNEDNQNIISEKEQKEQSKNNEGGNIKEIVIDIDTIIKKLYPFESKQISQKEKNKQIKKKIL